MSEISNERFNRVQFENESQWLDFKKTFIGGTGASAILGVNYFKSSYDYYLEKKGLLKEEDISQKPSVWYGYNAEYHLRELFKLKYKNTFEVYHQNYEVLIDKENNFLGGTLDGEILVLNDCIFEEIPLKKGMKGIYECKTASLTTSSQKEKWDDRIPEKYYLQCLHYLMLTDYDFVILNAELSYPRNEDISLIKTTKNYIILKESKKEEIEYLKQKEIEWWNEYYLKNKIPPMYSNL